MVELKGHTGAVWGVSFSPDGTRIVTGSDDMTARVWDVGTGTPLLELKGHTSWVWGVSFSPDGTRIVTGSIDKTAKVWDAQSGTPIVELKLQVGEATRVSFSADGSRIITGGGDDNAAKVWDARTGQELKGESISTAPLPGRISADGRWIAHVVVDRVELVPLQPDTEELEYRRLLTQPSTRRYRDGYFEAKKSGDEFAVRFYFNLLPARERTQLLAEEIVAPCSPVCWSVRMWAPPSRPIRRPTRKSSRPA